MEYYVIGPDGKEYGPANLDSLKQWVGERRIDANTMLKDSQSGATILASAIPGLIPSSPPPMQNQPPAASYQPPSPGQTYVAPTRKTYGGEGWGFVTAVGIRCALACVFFFAFHGIGLITSGYALFYAIQGKSNGHRHGTIAIAMAGTTVALIGIGWLIRIAMTGSAN